MLSNLEILFSRLHDAQFASLLIEPLLLYGLLFGVLFFAVGHYMGQPKCRTAALIVIAVCSLCVNPYVSLRKKAMTRELTNRPSDAMIIKEQQQRRIDTTWVYYSLAIVAVLSLISGGKIAQFSDYAIIGGGIGIIFLSAWLHMKDAEIYHRELVQRAVPVR